MGRKKRGAVPPSLVHLFEPPEGYRGLFGWLCGYTADSHFLELAAERFTQLTHPRRSHRGCISLVAMLDGGNRQISPVEVPGLLHIPLRSDAKHDFRLLHAKVALLGFVNEQDSQKWCLRLIVSTGNWTAQTLDQSLDLAWQINLSSTQLASPTEEVRQAFVDIRAAAAFFDALRVQCDTRALDWALPEQRTSETALASRRFDQWVAQVGELCGSKRARFFDNRRESLLQQLPVLVRTVGGATARNYLAMGSGFYEGPGDPSSIPTVLAQIVSSLQKGGSQKVLTALPEIDLFVNPLCCQGVAKARSAFFEGGWTLRPAEGPEWLKGPERSLHAKFIFSGNARRQSDTCTSAWIYLGSGNLTKPGFAMRASRQGGNLEAGVVLGCDDLKWTEISELLPIQWERDFDSGGDLKAGAEMEEKERTFFAPPVPCLQLAEHEGQRWLQLADKLPATFHILGPGKDVCTYDPVKGFEWLGDAPRQVRVRWKEGDEWHEAEIPIIDDHGRIAATPLRPLDLEGAWSQLMNFPLPPPEEDLDGGETQPDDPQLPDGKPKAVGARKKAQYPIRALMTLVENIAGLQERLQPADWATWCARLEQTLNLSAQCPTVQHCREFGINVLSPLRERPFRPPFAQDRSTEAGQQYEDLLKRVEKLWGIDGFPKLGRSA